MTICALCRRSLLAGERYRHWEPRGEDRGLRALCVLCEPEAASLGWRRTERAPGRVGADGSAWTVRLVA